MSSFARVITHDHRGVGVSSRDIALPTLERRVEDLIAVLRAAGSRRPVLVGALSSGAVHVLLAATRPQLPRALVWLEPAARSAWSSDYPWGIRDEDHRLETEFIALWGTEAYARTFWEEQEAMGNALPPEQRDHEAIQTRNACSPDVAASLSEIWHETDVRGVLSAVAAPSLLIVHEGRASSVEEAEYIASQMPKAEVASMPGAGWTVQEAAAWVEQIREFVGLPQPEPLRETILATVMFTDIVGSTEKQAELGDRAWKDLIARHHAIVRDALARHGGIENDTAGDGFYATFEGPARAIRCALDVSEAVRDIGIEIRAGLHTGECELVDGKPAGLSVSIGARVAAEAHASEILVSQTVKDLVAGSGLKFQDAGEHALKGVSGRWHVHRVVA
jgi:class 3 adenylate cyclase